MRRLLVVLVTMVLVGGCGGSDQPVTELAAPPGTSTGTLPPATTTTPQKPKPKPKAQRPHLPRMQGEVLAVGRGGRENAKAVTVFLTLDGRELARLPRYVPHAYDIPGFYGDLPVKWTLRDGRVVRAAGQRAIRVRGFRRDCTVLATVPAGTLVSCYPGPGTGALLLRRPDGVATELVSKPPHTFGHWVNAYVSPDRTQLLLTWSRECESPTAFVAPAAGGEPTVFTGDADWRAAQESYALGWTRDGRALAYLTEGICGPSGGPPGAYARVGSGPPTLVARGHDAAFFSG